VDNTGWSFYWFLSFDDEPLLVLELWSTEDDSLMSCHLCDLLEFARDPHCFALDERMNSIPSSSSFILPQENRTSAVVLGIDKNNNIQVLFYTFDSYWSLVPAPI
jgi:hypothetical protein